MKVAVRLLSVDMGLSHGGVGHGHDNIGRWWRIRRPGVWTWRLWVHIYTQETGERRGLDDFDTNGEVVL
jgi:hypothetical protein